MRGKEKEGIFGEVGRGERVGRGGAGGRPIWGGRFGWGTRGFLFVIGCGDFLFLIMVSVWVWLLGLGHAAVGCAGYWFSRPTLVFSRSVSADLTEVITSTFLFP